ncbi:uncharacterized protein [Dermacentor albipictus]|uniref:uncharacterized protein n=1 Tax=Dermacentor albipictus TaxID=60249 RepID=UPI0038FCCFE0
MPPPASSSARGSVRVLSPDDDTARNASPSLPPAAKQPRRSASMPLSRESSTTSSVGMDRTPSEMSTSNESMGNLTSSSSDTTSCDTSCSSSLSLQSTAMPWDSSRFRPPLHTDQSQSSGLPTPSEWLEEDPAAARGSASSAVSAGPHAPVPSPVSFGQGIGELSSLCKPVARYPESKAPLFTPFPTSPDSSRAAGPTSDQPTAPSTSLHTAAASGTPSTSARGQCTSQEEAEKARCSLLQHPTARDDSHNRRPTGAAFRAPPTACASGGVGQAAHTENPSPETQQDSDGSSHSSDEYR